MLNNMQHKQIPLFPEYRDGDEIDTFVPLHPAFNVNKDAKVFALKDKSTHKTTNLATNTCSCVAGKPYDWHEKRQKWVPMPYCIHKLKVMAHITDKAEDDFPEVLWAYCRALGSRYNIFEATSAFHKELRRGDVPAALYWGSVYAAGRSIRGTIRYMLNILYEETRDHTLGHLLLSYYTKPDLTIVDVHKMIAMFCASKKKWELPDRLAIFRAEMSGYGSLINDYGVDVAKASNIIPATDADKLFEDIVSGYRKSDHARVQRGLKGLQKLQHAPNKLPQLRRRVFDWLRTTFKITPEAQLIADYITAREQADLPIGYHELNAFVDCLLHDESYEAGNISKMTQIRVMRHPAKTLMPLGRTISVPVYAHDNHTWAGKAKMNRYHNQLMPNVEQTNLDFRFCGAYYGVAWRYFAYNQFKSISVPYHEVMWEKKLHTIVLRMFY